MVGGVSGCAGEGLLRTFCGPRTTFPTADEYEDAVPRCPKCLVLFDVEGDERLPYLECPSCGDVFL